MTLVALPPPKRWRPGFRLQGCGGVLAALVFAAAYVLAAPPAGPPATPAAASPGPFAIGLYRDGKLVQPLGDLQLEDLTAGSSAGAPARARALARAGARPAPSDATIERNKLAARVAAAGTRIQQRMAALDRSAGIEPLAGDAELDAMAVEFRSAQQELRDHLAGVKADLVQRDLDPVILERHDATLRHYDERMAAFEKVMAGVAAGQSGAGVALRDFFAQSQFHSKSASPKPPTVQVHTIEAPRLSRAEADAQLHAGDPSAAAAARLEAIKVKRDRAGKLGKTGPLGGVITTLSPPPGPADLAATPEVQITQEITDKAAALGNAPLAIYEFVRNNVGFQPYLGSRKGAVNTLHQLHGNDTDQASLLIALLRAAGIPARYARGTVELTPEQAMSLTGTEEPHTAASILTTAGLDGVAIVNGATVTAVRCTRVWVEAYVPYSNYRGVPYDDSGKTWIPLDPGFKAWSVTPGEDVLTAMGWNADAFLENYISTFHVLSPLEQLQADIQTWLDGNEPGKTVADIERQLSVAAQQLGLLPASLPYQLVSADSEFSELEDGKRYKVRFQLYDGGITFIDQTVRLSDLAGHRLTIEYVGATPADQAVIDSFGGIYDTPPNLVNVKPVLKLNNVAIATSANSIGMGQTHNSDMEFLQPAGASNVQPTVQNDIIAGSGQAIAFDTFFDAWDSFFSSDSPPLSLLESELQSSAVDYLGRVDRGQEQAERLMQIVSTQDVSEAIVENSIKVTYSGFGVPLTFEWTGLVVDADRRIVGPFAVNGDTAKNVPYMRLTGYDGSTMENRIFEDTYAQQAVSTIKILELSSDQGIPVFRITTGITADAPGLNQPASVVNAINAALAQGHQVVIPRNGITVGNWSGTGYIDLNPSTGAAGYIISGGINGGVSNNGGATVESWPVFLPCWFPTVSNDPTDPIKTYRPGFFSDTEADAFMACDEHPIRLKGYFKVQCPNRPDARQYFNRTTSNSIKSIADFYGPGEYELRFLTTVFLKFTIIKVEFKKLFETSNPANLIYNGTYKDDPPPIDRNRLFVVQAPGSGNYEASLEVDVTPDSYRNRLMYGIFRPEFVLPYVASGTLASSNPTAINFAGYPADDGVAYEVRVGVDIDADGELDEDEACPLEVKDELGGVIGPPFLHADGTSRYSTASAIIDGGILLPGQAPALLQIFRDGGPGGLSASYRPSSPPVAVPLNCFATAVGFSEWLTHNSGASFSPAGSATISQYFWDIDTGLAQYVAESGGIRSQVTAYYIGSVKTSVDAFFASLPVGSVSTFPSAGSYYPIVSSTTTLDFMDNAIGRGRLYQLKGQFTVEKKSGLLGTPYLEVTSMRIVGSLEDLYDFNRITGFPGNHAAVLQIGHGNGSYGASRSAGMIYRDMVNFDEIIANPF